MMPTVITSRDNSLLRQARGVRDGKIPELIFVEGLRLCEEALRSGLSIQAVIYSEEIAQKERATRLLANIAAVSERLASVSEKLLATISYTKTPQGIVALARRPNSGPEELAVKSLEAPLLVIVHGINNPANVGAILRSAEAAGLAGAIVTESTADPFSAKALRGAMGSAFRLPIWAGASYAEALTWCAESDIKTVCTDVGAVTSYTEIDWKNSKALIVGPEASGLTREEVAAADEAIKIPMHGEVESLNVAVATGIVLYEAARQRGQRG